MAMTRKQKRLATIGALGLAVAAAAALILTGLRDQIVFFYTPTELVEKAVAAGQPVRVGGLVKEGSVVHQGDTITFVVTDGATEVGATFVGIAPDLFKEGQGVIAEGSLNADGSFRATTVLAKHDENYFPPAAIEKLKATGEWRPETTAATGAS